MKENKHPFNGRQCTYYTAGTGYPLVLVHGFIEEGSMWSEVVKRFSKIYKVIVPDLIGFGKSGQPAEVGELSMELYADQIFDVLKKEKVKRCIMLGHSMGGYVTLHFAEEHASMLDGFGLINSHCFEDTTDKKENRLKGIEFIKKYGTKQFITELYAAIFHEKFKKKNAEVVGGLIVKAWKYSPEAVMAANRAMMLREDKSDVLKDAKVPVLFVGGKEDPSAPLDLMLKQAPMPAIADVHIYSQCKHMSIFERKKETLQAIESFLGLCGK